MKDINFIGIRSASWFQETKNITFGSFFKIIFKILEVHGKRLMNYSIGNQIKMMT